jgi:predicted O-methyltransferase YrrM
MYSVFDNQQCDVATGAMLYNAVLNSPEGDIIEIGTAFGGSTVFLIGAAQVIDKQVISIDPYPTGDYCYAKITPVWRAFFKNNFLDHYDNIVQHNCDITECLNLLPGTISVGFIDGDHHTENANREFDILLEKLCPGGYLVLDDTHLESLQTVAARICEPQFSHIETVGITHAKFGRLESN